MTEYEDDIINMSPENIINEIKDNKKDETFWHLIAPYYLSPDVNQRTTYKTRDKIELPPKDRISMRQIVNKLLKKSGLKTKDIKAIFYYDKYVKNKWQKLTMRLFLSCFPDDKIKIIITEKEGDYNDLENYATEIVDISAVFTNPKYSQHDRYIVFITDNNKIIWNITNSANYLKYNDENPTVDTKGIIRDSVVISKIKNERMLKEDLLNFINNKITEYYETAN